MYFHFCRSSTLARLFDGLWPRATTLFSDHLSLNLLTKKGARFRNPRSIAGTLTSSNQNVVKMVGPWEEEKKESSKASLQHSCCSKQGTTTYDSPSLQSLSPANDGRYEIEIDEEWNTEELLLIEKAGEAIEQTLSNVFDTLFLEDVEGSSLNAMSLLDEQEMITASSEGANEDVELDMFMASSQAYDDGTGAEVGVTKHSESQRSPKYNGLEQISIVSPQNEDVDDDEHPSDGIEVTVTESDGGLINAVQIVKPIKSTSITSSGRDSGKDKDDDHVTKPQPILGKTKETLPTTNKEDENDLRVTFKPVSQSRSNADEKLDNIQVVREARISDEEPTITKAVALKTGSEGDTPNKTGFHIKPKIREPYPVAGLKMDLLTSPEPRRFVQTKAKSTTKNKLDVSKCDTNHMSLGDSCDLEQEPEDGFELDYSPRQNSVLRVLSFKKPKMHATQVDGSTESLLLKENNFLRGLSFKKSQMNATSYIDSKREGSTPSSLPKENNFLWGFSFKKFRSHRKALVDDDEDGADGKPVTGKDNQGHGDDATMSLLSYRNDDQYEEDLLNTPICGGDGAWFPLLINERKKNSKGHSTSGNEDIMSTQPMITCCVFHVSYAHG